MTTWASVSEPSSSWSASSTPVRAWAPDSLTCDSVSVTADFTIATADNSTGVSGNTWTPE